MALLVIRAKGSGGGSSVSTRTRRLVFIAALFVALAIPAETVLLRALIQPSQQVAVQDWVEGLSSAQFTQASESIQWYPFQYRREIMRRHNPEGRSRVWRGHMQAFLASRPDLDANTVTLIRTAADLLTPAYFEQPTDVARTSLHAVAEQIQTALGRDDAEYLLYRLGPKDGSFASFEPLAMSITNKVRGLIQVDAVATPNCECAMYWGCYSGANLCSQEMSCSTDMSWPMCGWAWSDPCDGVCLLG